MGNGTISQIGRWITYPFREEIPWMDLLIATLIIAAVVWFLSDGTQWPEFEAPEV